jgi:hypothetical protein
MHTFSNAYICTHTCISLHTCISHGNLHVCILRFMVTHTRAWLLHGRVLFTCMRMPIHGYLLLAYMQACLHDCLLGYLYAYLLNNMYAFLYLCVHPHWTLCTQCLHSGTLTRVHTQPYQPPFCAVSNNDVASVWPWWRGIMWDDEWRLSQGRHIYNIIYINQNMEHLAVGFSLLKCTNDLQFAICGSPNFSLSANSKLPVLKGTVSPDIAFDFRFCKIKSALSVRQLMVFNFCHILVL